MDLLLALSPLLVGLGALILDVNLTFSMGRGYYRLVCRVPVRPVPPLTLPPDDTWLRGRDLEVRVSADGLQVRCTKKKHHTLLRIRADGRVRAGTSVTMWLCLLAWLGGLVLLSVAALYQPLLTAVGMLAVTIAMGAGLLLLLRHRAHRMRDDAAVLITDAAGEPGGARPRRAAAP